MSFLNPLSLLLLLTVPLLILLYFLKLKRPRVKMASTLLWQKVIEDMRVNSPFQKLRRSLLLLLQVLALLAVIFALARPLTKMRDSYGQSLIVIMDNSASMSAKETSGKTRLEEARGMADDLIDSLSGKDEMMLISFSAQPEMICGFSASKRRLREAVDSVEPTAAGSRVGPALRLAKSICNSRGNPRVLLLSDGAFETSSVEMPVDIEYLQVGTNQPNLAITGLDIRRSIHDREKIEMFVAMENFSQETFTGSMDVKLDGTTLDNKYFSIKPGDMLSQIFEANLPAGGTIEVAFDAKDALALDNRAWKVVRPPTVRKVLIVGKNTFFLERAFKASPGVVVATASEEELVGETFEGYFTVIWNGVENPQVAPAHNLYFGCVPPIEGVVGGDEIKTPDIVDWDNAHPINRFLDFDNLLLPSTRELAVPEEAMILLKSSDTPLITLQESSYGGVVIVGFNPLRSNWPLLVSFPLFLNNCLDAFEQLEEGRTDANISVGSSISVPNQEPPPVILLPDGREVPMKLTPSGEYSFSDVRMNGVYEVRAEGRPPRQFAANLFDRTESTLVPEIEPEIGGKTLQAASVAKRIDKEFWRDLVKILALLLVVEWVVYHRRWFV